MNNELYDYLRSISSLPEKELLEIADLVPSAHYPKGTILLRQGDIARNCYFVLHGCVRQYSYDDDGREHTTNFFTEQQAVVTFTSYSQQAPSQYSLECIEDSLLVVGSLNTEQDMYDSFPQLKEITRKMMEENFGKTQDAFTAFMTATPEERYKTLLKSRPDLPNRVPQYQLASYLGITPESLSRIKKRLS